jgi:hypothetical protein
VAGPRSGAKRIANLLSPLLALVVMIIPVLSAENPEERHPSHPDGPRVAALAENERRALFYELVRASASWWRRTALRFPDRWSQHDDYAFAVRTYLITAAAARGIDYTELFLVYDEGIRKHWSPAGLAPLPATWEPLKPRTR